MTKAVHRFCVLATDTLEIPETRGFWFVMSPYTAYAKGITRAYEDTSEVCADLHEMGIRFFSPILHSHNMATQGNRLLPITADYWHSHNMPFLEASVGGILLRMRGWEQSRGVVGEARYFELSGKPVLPVDVAYPQEPE